MKLIKNKIIKNIYWLVIDKIVILILQFFIGVKIANHYGKINYGEYSYAVSIVAFAPIILEILNVRIIKKFFYKYNFNLIVSIVSTFKNIISIIILIFIIIFKFVIGIEENLFLMLVFLSIDNIFITSTIGIENYFEYKLNSKYIVLTNNVIKIFSYLLQYLGIILGFKIIMIPIIRCIGSLIRGILLRYNYRKVYKTNEKILFSYKILKKIIKESYYLWLSFISYIISTNMDKVMIGNMLGVGEVGVYSIGVQLIGILTIIISSFQSTIFSELLELYNEKDIKKYEKKYIFYTKILTNIYFVGIIISIIVLKKLFEHIFSIEYIKAINIYIILSIGILVKANVFLRSSHIVLANRSKVLLKSELIAMMSNLMLNYFLIKRYGIYGAATATTITQFISLWIIDLFSIDGRKLLKKHLSGFWIFDIKKYIR
ncbi:oligosaccharide flippase family protein [Fusobacterium ulcerans]|uniref:oligosaccharide flippase family protein n=1 Tax=Fusobacterium ulcerans TaxID=861 RepID=UPI0010328109|nr:oligosaccharide flippase family protein [Fusobacterium ulcerans]